MPESPRHEKSAFTHKIISPDLHGMFMKKITGSRGELKETTSMVKTHLRVSVKKRMRVNLP